MICKTTISAKGKGVEALDEFFVSGAEIDFNLIVPIPPIAILNGETAWKIHSWGFTCGACESWGGKYGGRYGRMVTDGDPYPLAIKMVERYPHLAFWFRIDTDTERIEIKGTNGRVTKEKVREITDRLSAIQTGEK